MIMVYLSAKEDINRFKLSLENATKVIFISDCNKKFFTSDNPVAISLVKGENILKLAILPLNNNVLLMYVNKDFCPVEYKNLTNSTKIIHPGEENIIDNINLFMVNDAYRRVFSSMDDFELVKLFIKREINCKIAFL